MDIYSLSRSFWDWSFENPEIIKPSHSALFFFAIEHCNRLGWKKKFRFPATMAMEAIGIRSYNTYKSTLDDLVEWGFIDIIERAKNQYSSNVIALSKNNKAFDAALDKALIKHGNKEESNRLELPPATSELSDETINRIEQATKKIAGFFGISEINQANHWMKIRRFIEFQAGKNNLDYLADQFTSYRILKDKKGYKHSWSNWIGDPSDFPSPYCEGSWNKENWTKKLKDLSESDNKKETVSETSYSELHEKTLKLSNQ